MFRFLLAIACFAAFPQLGRCTDLSYFLPADATYDPAIPTPKEFLGFEIGEKHLQHFQLHAYLKAISKSKRASLIEYAHSHGGRPLLLLSITSPKNHRQLDRIRETHLQLADPECSHEVDTKKVPAVVWMGYGVHGNEPSASNAAALVAYHLLACQDESIKQLLEETIILLDPCLNPDGFDRFSHWANNNTGVIANSDPQHREHRELSPSARTNHYWFDLNRDWLPAQHPESQGRLALYRKWMPNVVLDFHEMGTDASYFFQPGVPSRSHPLTPKRNLELTREFAKYHARALDKIGSLYFTEERFDDFYMGKGSTYPDLHGAVGILFEQASARGKQQDSINGLLTFPFAIRNQVTTSLSSLKATSSNRGALNDHLRDFYRDSLALGRNAPVQGYVFSAGGNRGLANEFIRLMGRHRIQVHALAKDLTIGSQRFDQATSYVIPAAQREYRFLLAATEVRKEFKDKVFYDITAWSMPLAFGLHWAEVETTLSVDVLGAEVDGNVSEPRRFESSDDDYAYLLDWNDLHAPRSLRRLLESGIGVKAAQQPFKMHLSDREQSFFAGTLMVHLGSQPNAAHKIHEILRTAVEQDDLRIQSVKTGLTPVGIDLGSSAFAKIELPKVMLVVGNGVNDYEAGEVWHLFDRRLGMPVSLVDSHAISTSDLDRYTTIVMVSGTYAQVSAGAVEKIASWLRRGGTLISLGSNARWLKSQKISSLEIREPLAKERTARMPYSEAEDQAALQKIEGTIFQTQLDPTHPLTFGIRSATLPVFRDQTMFLEPSANPFSTPAVYSDKNPLLSGYASDENIRLAAGSAAVVVKAEGAGRVIAIPNNPVFRGFWFGSERLLVNSIFFGPTVREP
ncbi:MAG: M14 family metallopeptidase [Pirellula sp.]